MKTSRRTLLLLTMLLLATMAMNARDNIIVEGSFARVHGVKKYSIEIDWTNLHVNGFTPGEWIRYRNAEQPAYDAEEEYQTELKPRWMDMVTAVNEKLNKKQLFFLPNASELEYKIIVSPHQIDKKGNLEAFCSIVDSDNEVLVKFVLTGKGGVFGSMGNLWGDGFKSTGKNLAKILEKHLIK